MKIALMRHGKPALSDSQTPRGCLNLAIFNHWVEAYQQAKVDSQFPPDTAIIQSAQGYRAVISSDLPRSQTSCDSLQISSQDSDSLFREADLPVPTSAFLQSLSLPLNVWLIGLRLSWFFGFSAEAESYAKASQRAQRAAAKLQALASEHGSVLLVGHGVFNRLIAKQLNQKHWKVVTTHNKNSHWGMQVFERD